MAVIVTSNPTGLKLKFNVGTDAESGRTIYRTRTYTNVSPDATDQNMFDVANAISSLQKNPIVEIARVDNNTLSA